MWPDGALGERALPCVNRLGGMVVTSTMKENVTPVVVEGTNETVAASLQYAKWIMHTVKPKAKGKASE